MNCAIRAMGSSQLVLSMRSISTALLQSRNSTPFMSPSLFTSSTCSGTSGKPSSSTGPSLFSR